MRRSSFWSEVVRVATGKPLTTEELIPHIADADAVIAGLDNYNKEVIEAGKKLKVISRYGVGYDKVDVCTARAKNIAVIEHRLCGGGAPL